MSKYCLTLKHILTHEINSIIQPLGNDPPSRHVALYYCETVFTALALFLKLKKINNAFLGLDLYH